MKISIFDRVRATLTKGALDALEARAHEFRDVAPHSAAEIRAIRDTAAKGPVETGLWRLLRLFGFAPTVRGAIFEDDVFEVLKTPEPAPDTVTVQFPSEADAQWFVSWLHTAGEQECNAVRDIVGRSTLEFTSEGRRVSAKEIPDG